METLKPIIMANILLTHTVLLRTHLESCRRLSNGIGPCIFRTESSAIEILPYDPLKVRLR